MKPRVLAIAAHPDDIEIFMAGTLLRLAAAGWELHYFNLSCGNGGSLEMDGETAARVRLEEARAWRALRSPVPRGRHAARRRHLRLLPPP